MWHNIQNQLTLLRNFVSYKKKRMLDYWLDGKNYATQFFKFNPDIYFRQRACRVSVVSVDVQFLLSDHPVARRHETGNIPLPGVPTFSSFPILQQTNKTLVSLLSFKDRLIGTVKFCFQNRKLKNMQVLLITRLSAIDPGQLNEVQFVYMHVIDK